MYKINDVGIDHFRHTIQSLIGQPPRQNDLLSWASEVEDRIDTGKTLEIEIAIGGCVKIVTLDLAKHFTAVIF